MIEAHALRDAVPRSDWVCVNRFDRPHQPVALALPPGQGTQLRDDLRTLVADLRTLIPAVFESEEYATQAERINGEFKQRAERALHEVAQEQLLRALRSHMRVRKEHADRVRALDRATTLMAVEHAIDAVKARYATLPAVVTYLEAVQADVIDNASDFRTRDEEDGGEGRGEEPAALGRYEVNVVLDAGASPGAPIVEADLPMVHNLVGRVDHIARFGALLTDFRLIKGGLLHKANGGHLLVDAVKLLQQPFAWPTLKRVLARREIRIESLGEMASIISTVQLEPDPIPLDIKVVLLGERWVCEMLQALDPEFDELLRVLADVGDDMPRDGGHEPAPARMLAGALARAPARGRAARHPDDRDRRRSRRPGQRAVGVRGRRRVVRHRLAH